MEESTFKIDFCDEVEHCECELLIFELPDEVGIHLFSEGKEYSPENSPSSNLVILEEKVLCNKVSNTSCWVVL